jgi:hypothetical protein
MNQIQQIAVAAGFVQALYESDDVRDLWVASLQSTDWAGLCVLIQQTLGLAQTPSEDDLAAMRTYVATYTPASPTTVQGEDPRVLAAYVFNGMNPPPPGGARSNPPG